MEERPNDEERQLFDSDSELDEYEEEEHLMDLSQRQAEDNMKVYREIYKEKYPNNFTSIYLNQT